ncbi:MAG: DUF2782 domain-containing protein [Gammaproteobacteria bacterium]
MKLFTARIVFLGLMLLSAFSISAQEEQAPPPPLPEDTTNLPEPEVTIVHKKEAVIEEYRVNGQLRFAKITPTKGPAYYMIDTDGDGLLDKRDDNLDNPPINQWILLRW